MRKKILVISHERSGTHFLINTIAQCFDYREKQIDLDNTQGINWRNSTEVRQWLQQFRGKFTPRIFKSHHDHLFLEPLLPELLDEFHIFYITRDGRDVMTSFWVYLNRLAPGWGPQTSNVGEFMRSRPFGGITQYQFDPQSGNMLQRWVEHTEGWKNLAPGIHHISYEELHTGFDTTLDRISDALGQGITRSDRPELTAPSSLPWKGNIGTWKEYFTESDIQYFNRYTQNIS